MGDHRVYRKAECEFCHIVRFIAAKGLCRTCYSRLQTTGRVEPIARRQRTICCIEGCEKVVVSHGYCDTHRIRDRKKHPPRPLSMDARAVQNREYRKANFDRIRSKELKTKFGITLAQYNEMLERQGGGCGICKKLDKRIHHRTGKPMNLAVDHCHKSKKVRGLLCGPCNHGIGNFNEDVSLLKLAIAYLESH